MPSMETLRGRNIICSRCCRILRARCTWATCAITRSATRWRVTGGCADSTCCIRWDGTRSDCRRKMRRSRTGFTRASGPTANIAEFQRVLQQVWLQLRLAARDFHVRAGILPLEPVVFSADAGEGNRLPQKEPRELVSEVRDGAGERAGDRRVLLAARDDAGGSEGDRAVVLPHHAVRGRIAGRHEAARRRMAGARPGDAAELDREIARHARVDSTWRGWTAWRWKFLRRAWIRFMARRRF